MGIPYEELPDAAKQAYDQIAEKADGGTYDMKINHWESCAHWSGGACDCTPEVKVARAINEVEALLSVATEIRKLTATVAAAVANPKNVEFERDKKSGDIVSARIKPQ